MRSAIRRRLHRWVVIAFSVVAFLPPGAWSLCSGPDGHWELEPTASDCSEEFADPIEGSDCSAATHESCSDYLVLSGQALRTSDHGDPLKVLHRVALVMPHGSSLVLTPADAPGLAVALPASRNLSHSAPILRC